MPEISTFYATSWSINVVGAELEVKGGRWAGKKRALLGPLGAIWAHFGAMREGVITQGEEFSAPLSTLGPVGASILSSDGMGKEAKLCMFLIPKLP